MFDWFTKENIALYGVLILFLWRVIDYFIRMKKKRENELEKLAFEMAKYRCNDEDDSYQRKSLFAFYLFYLDALEKNIRPSQHTCKVIIEFEHKLTNKIQRLEAIQEKITELKNKLANSNEVIVSDLWDKNITWSLLRSDIKVLAKRLFKSRTKFRSL